MFGIFSSIFRNFTNQDQKEVTTETNDVIPERSRDETRQVGATFNGSGVETESSDFTFGDSEFENDVPRSVEDKKVTNIPRSMEDKKAVKRKGEESELDTEDLEHRIKKIRVFQTLQPRNNGTTDFKPFQDQGTGVSFFTSSPPSSSFPPSSTSSTSSTTVLPGTAPSPATPYVFDIPFSTQTGHNFSVPESKEPSRDALHERTKVRVNRKKDNKDTEFHFPSFPPETSFSSVPDRKLTPDFQFSSIPETPSTPFSGPSPTSTFPSSIFSDGDRITPSKRKDPFTGELPDWTSPSPFRYNGTKAKRRDRDKKKNAYRNPEPAFPSSWESPDVQTELATPTSTRVSIGDTEMQEASPEGETQPPDFNRSVSDADFEDSTARLSRSEQRAQKSRWNSASKAEKMTARRHQRTQAEASERRSNATLRARVGVNNTEDLSKFKSTDEWLNNRFFESKKREEQLQRNEILQREEMERKQQIEKERLEKERLEKERLELERKRQIEKERIEKERLAQERKEREKLKELERKRQIEHERIERERREIEREKQELEQKQRQMELENARLRREMEQREKEREKERERQLKKEKEEYEKKMKEGKEREERKKYEEDQERSPIKNNLFRRHTEPINVEMERQKRREEEERLASERIRSRVSQRTAEMKENEEKELNYRSERMRLQRVISPIIKRRIAGKSHLQLIREFCPKARLPPSPDMDLLRREMRRAMARFHPDRSRDCPLQEQIENEEIFAALKKSYDELVEQCSRL